MAALTLKPIIWEAVVKIMLHLRRYRQVDGVRNLCIRVGLEERNRL